MHGIQSAVEGTLNVLRQAVAAGIHKAVVTSSWATLLDRKSPGVRLEERTMNQFSLADNKDAFTGITFTEKSESNGFRKAI